MEQVRSVFLNSLKHGLRGTQLSSREELSAEQWEKLAELAGEHKVTPLMFDAVRTQPQLQDTEVLSRLRQQSRQQIVVQTRKSYDFLRVYESLRQAGITPLVVKGIICRNLYPQPDLRPSSDEDLLILPEQVSKCHEILCQNGLRTAATPEQMETDYEIPYRSAVSPLFLELHKHLFPPESGAYGDMNRFFDGVFGRAIREEIQGVSVYTLSHTDHLLYLICHAFKHFLHSGFGIRQVCDIVLYANTYGAQIDWDYVLNSCRQFRGEQFAAAIFRIGSKHLVFDPEKAAYPPAWQEIAVNEMPMLEDLLSGGVYGGASMSRKHSSNITLDAVTAQKRGKKKGHGVLAVVFPSAAKLEGRYPYLKKHPYLLPVAWCSRIWTYGKETRNTKNNRAADAVKIGSERIELLKEYGILR